MSLTAEQKEARKTGLGGSDAPVALGLSKWRTPLDLYFDKCGMGTPFEETEKMEWGTVLEPVIRERWAARRGATVDVWNSTVRSVDYPWMVANVDGVLVGENAGLEIKTVSGGACADWGEPDTDDVPMDYLVQVYHYAIVTRIPRWYVAALFNGSELRTYVVDTQPQLMERIVAAERAFWQHVERKEPPPPVSVEDVAKLWPSSRAAKVDATDDVAAHVAAILRLRQQVEELEREVEDHKVAVTSYMKDADTLMHNGRAIVTWKAGRDVTKVDLDALRKGAPDVARRYSFTAPAPRRFLLK